MRIPPVRIADFRSRVWDNYDHQRRAMPWRDDHSFYAVLVSELMLQQTQVTRVIPKFHEFMRRFPTIEILADAPLADVLIAWQGLGYNRRAKYLNEAAKAIVLCGVPQTRDELIALPGIGANTAGAIMAYAYNKPEAFVETNIRTVYLHEFFLGQKSVTDAQIIEYVAATIDRTNPRKWYWALMDYGRYLKAHSLGDISASRHYKKQTPFQGSLRQVRGAILRELTHGPTDTRQLKRHSSEHFDAVRDGLIRDGLIEQHGDIICLTAHSDQS